MWMIPISFSAYNLWYRFIVTWIIFTALSAFIFSKALEKPLRCTTPRLVYKWFYLLHKVSYGMGIFGYCVMMATIMGLNFIFGADPHTWMDFSVMLLFYGIYYGVLGRDLAEICSDKLAIKIGSSNINHAYAYKLSVSCKMVNEKTKGFNSCFMVIWNYRILRQRRVPFKDARLQNLCDLWKSTPSQFRRRGSH